MSSFNSTLVLNVLWKDYPDVANRITDKITYAMPEVVLSDHNEIKSIVEQYCEFKGLRLETWNNQHGQTRITDDRELLLGAIIMFYQPERLNRMCEKRIKQGIVKELSIVLSCSKQVVSKSIKSAIDNYRIYEKFKNEVHHVYDLLKLNYHDKNC